MLYAKENVLEILKSTEVGYKEITQLDSFYKVKQDELNYEIRFDNVNYVIATDDTVKLYFGISCKVYERTKEDEQLFYKDLKDALSVIEKGETPVWENP
jgi:hypothetical protein